MARLPIFTQVCSCSLAGKASFSCSPYHLAIPRRRQENAVLLGRECSCFPVTLPVWKRRQNARCNRKKDLGVLLSRHRWAMPGHPRPPTNAQLSLGSRRFCWTSVAPSDVPPSRKGSTIAGVGFAEFQTNLDGTEPGEKLLILFLSHNLKACIRTSV